jgi:hypothetical protein
VTPFFIITPLGIASAEAIVARVAELGIAIVHRERVEGWRVLATALYMREGDEAGLAKARAYEDAWRALGGGADAAEVVELAGIEDHRKLVAAKRELRAEFFSMRKDLLRLHLFHVPDEERLAVEHAIVRVARARDHERSR